MHPGLATTWLVTAWIFNLFTPSRSLCPRSIEHESSGYNKTLQSQELKALTARSGRANTPAHLPLNCIRLFRYSKFDMRFPNAEKVLIAIYSYLYASATGSVSSSPSPLNTIRQLEIHSSQQASIIKCSPFLTLTLIPPPPPKKISEPPIPVCLAVY